MHVLASALYSPTNSQAGELKCYEDAVGVYRVYQNTRTSGVYSVYKDKLIVYNVKDLTDFFNGLEVY